jgi:hypothetical protein
MKSFLEFSERKINEADTFIFDGFKGDPYQYKVELDQTYLPDEDKAYHTYYAKKSLGTLDATSDKWIEQTSERGKPAIIDLLSKTGSDKIKSSYGDKNDNVVKETTLDGKTKEKIMELQGILNEAKKKLPKIWTLPLKLDGDAGWKTAFSWYSLMIIYPQQPVNDGFHYDSNAYKQFKEGEIANGFQTPLEYLTKYKDDGVLKDLDLDSVIKQTKDQVDFINGNLPAGSIVNGNLPCKSITNSIPENITAETVTIEWSCPIRTIPKTLKCLSLLVQSRNKQNPITIPKIECPQIFIVGPVTISPDWDHIDYLSLNDDQGYGPATILKIPIPETLKSIGELTISSPTITSLPDNLTIGEIKENYVADVPPPEVKKVEDKIKTETEEIIPVTGKKKRPWWKRLFGIKESRIYEGYSRYGNLYIVDCFELKTLPKGLTVLGDFYIEGSGIAEAYTDEQIREVCTIKGRILRTGGEEGVLQIP